MSKHYHGNQFEDAFVPSMIQNYIVKKYCCDMPKTKIRVTKAISNPRGHILPGAPRPVGKDAIIGSHYIGTWQMPKKLDRKTCNIINGSADFRKRLIECRKQAFLTAQQIKRIEEKRARAAEREAIKLLKEKEKVIAEMDKKVEAGEIDLSKLCPIHQMNITFE
ncbi:unnamed protein product [Phyllotreta striolata]|uniref:Cilia- and flagella-associated protein 126 n=1 Tax=Phyllotreta striolata TaxID=444603 RepID=A0A9N9TEH6_PHYSR|nr:unnamed protein product [Phyllotreta striolata]